MSSLAETIPISALSAHTRLRLSGRFGAGDWREVQPLADRSLRRAHVVDDGVAFAVSLRAEPEGAGAPYVVAAALAKADGSILGLWGDMLLDREADLAARIAAEM